jgi:acetyl esterase/lipase
LKSTPDFTKIVGGPDVEAEWIPPAKNILFGEIKAAAEKNNVEGIKIPGYWYFKPGINERASPSRGEKVALCIHGGSFISVSKEHIRLLISDLTNIDVSTPIGSPGKHRQRDRRTLS